jgi:hypothetical protein
VKPGSFLPLPSSAFKDFLELGNDHTIRTPMMAVATTMTAQG